MTIDQAMQLAMQHHQAGRLAEAEKLYQHVLAQQPRHADALHLLGVLVGQAGHNEQAVELIKRAIQIASANDVFHGNLGEFHRRAGHLDQAIDAFHKAISLGSRIPDTYNNLAIALKARGQLDLAINAFRQAIALRPNYPQAHGNLGNALKDKGQLREAIAAYRQAIALQPDQPQTYSNLGDALCETGQLEEAIAACRRAIALHPNFPEAHNNLGHALKAIGQLDAAIAAFQIALSLNPTLAQAHDNLGAALCDKGQPAQAIAALTQAIALKPDLASAHGNLGNALKDRGDFGKALAAYSKAIELRPDLAEAHYNRAHTLLLLGDLQNGWQEYEWRWKVKGAFPQRPFAQPQWTGQPLDGRSILLHADQGLGDTLQFIRYAPLLAQRGASVIVQCQPPLVRLLKNMPHLGSVHAHAEPLPPFDFHCPLHSLPLAMDTRLETIPADVPYLRAQAASALEGPGPHIGLAWAGNPRHKNDRNRSIPLQNLAPLAQAPAQFHSLQVGPPAAQIADVPQLHLIDHSPSLNDFVDLANLIQSLDLIITVDTAVAHLAGAMAKPVWLMLPFVPDWRWMLDRTDTPWYPTMRLFRQSAIHDWAAVVQRTKQALMERCR